MPDEAWNDYRQAAQTLARRALERMGAGTAVRVDLGLYYRPKVLTPGADGNWRTAVDMDTLGAEDVFGLECFWLVHIVERDFFQKYVRAVAEAFAAAGLVAVEVVPPRGAMERLLALRRALFDALGPAPELPAVIDAAAAALDLPRFDRPSWHFSVEPAPEGCPVVRMGVTLGYRFGVESALEIVLTCTERPEGPFEGCAFGGDAGEVWRSARSFEICRWGEGRPARMRIDLTQRRAVAGYAPNSAWE